MTELEDGDDVFLRTDDKIYLQCTRTHENKQGTVSSIIRGSYLVGKNFILIQILVSWLGFGMVTIFGNFRDSHPPRFLETKSQMINLVHSRIRAE